MTDPAEPSLRLGFDETRTKVILRVQEEGQNHLVRLTARFDTGSQRGMLAAEIDLEDFLSHLTLINHWHDPADFVRTRSDGAGRRVSAGLPGGRISAGRRESRT